jgi:hypothetical protein
MIASKIAAAALIVFIALVVSPVRADDNSRSGVDTLKGLHGVRVVVEDISSDLASDGITTDKIQSNVEDQLKKAGITVMDSDTWKNDPAHPFLYVRVSSIKSDDGKYYAYNVDVELNQSITTQQNSSSGDFGDTWDTGTIGIVQIADVSHIYDRVTEDVGEFVSDFNSQNSTASAKKLAPERKPTQVASK